MELTIAATENANCSNLIRKIFQHKYGATIFTITGPFVSDEKIAISEDKNHGSAFVRSFKIFKHLFNAFGNMIQYLKIDFEHIDPIDGQTIVQYVNKNCVKSLVMLTLEDCKASVLDDLNSTFPNIIESTFSSSPSQRLTIKEDVPSLNNLFPKLNQLQIEYTRASDWKLIGDAFPNLKCVHVNLPKTKVEELPDEQFVVNLMQKSTEINHLSIKHSSLKLLKEANDLLPELENLELHYLAKNYLDFDGDRINFDNVIGLTVFEDQSEFKIPEKIFFHRLEQLTLNLQPEFSDTWIDFIKVQLNQTIFLLNLTVGVLSSEHLLTIPVVLPNLQTAIIRCGTDFTAGEIVTFLEKSKYLKQADMIIQMENLQQEQLKGKLQGKWKYAIQPARRRVKITLERYVRIGGGFWKFFGNLKTFFYDFFIVFLSDFLFFSIFFVFSSIFFSTFINFSYFF